MEVGIHTNVGGTFAELHKRRCMLEVPVCDTNAEQCQATLQFYVPTPLNCCARTLVLTWSHLFMASRYNRLADVIQRSSLLALFGCFLRFVFDDFGAGSGASFAAHRVTTQDLTIESMPSSRHRRICALWNLSACSRPPTATWLSRKRFSWEVRKVYVGILWSIGLFFIFLIISPQWRDRGGLLGDGNCLEVVMILSYMAT